jgi:cysteine desulfurase / selenocysteine lyase
MTATPYTIESPALDDLANAVVGADMQVPVRSGEMKRYRFLDNGASTPMLTCVADVVNESLRWYSSVHRGSGFKSKLSTHAYEEARHVIETFAGMEDDGTVAILCRNTTEALNILAHRLGLEPDDVVITTVMEHHSDLLPWRSRARVVYVGADDKGRIYLDELEQKLSEHGDNVKLVTISGASNVTGVIPPLKEIARLVHKHGALFAVDAAQLAPHRKIQIGPTGGEESIDFLTISAHKMYAPLGAGALIARKDAFREEAPLLRGGGSVSHVSLEGETWNSTPERDEAGSPNVVGAVAFGAAAATLMHIGFDRIVKHELMLTEYLIRGLNSIGGVTIYGPSDLPVTEDKLGVVTFNVDGLPFNLVSSILSAEHAIGVRGGRFCAQPYLEHLLGLTREEIADVRQRMLAGDPHNLPGMVRASFGLYNTTEDVDALLKGVAAIVAGDYGEYIVDDSNGDYLPVGFEPDLNEYFSFGINPE